ncbi:hypothetical protein Tco_1480150 [Tanacetum coccineum]
MRGKPKKLLNTDKPKVLENPNSTLNSKQHHVTSHCWPGSYVYGHRSDSEGLFQTLPLSRAIEQPVTLESSGEITQPSLYCHLPLEGIPSQVPSSTSCGLKRKSQTGDALDVFDRYSKLCARNVLPRYSSSSPQLPHADLHAFERYSQLCAVDTTVHSRRTSYNVVGTNNAKSAQMISSDSLNTSFVLNENLGHQWINITSTRKSLGK